MYKKPVNITLIYPLLALILSPIFYKLLVPIDLSLTIIENSQLIILLFGSVICITFAIQQKEQRLFWLWAALWWILLFGRSINWGRLYFPEYPREYYRIIGILIGSCILIPFLISQFRQPIVTVIQRFGIPYKAIIILALIFIMVDQVEQNRLIFQLITELIPIQHTELLEEIIESFFILGLFECILYYRAKIINSGQHSQICFNIKDYQSC